MFTKHLFALGADLQCQWSYNHSANKMFLLSVRVITDIILNMMLTIVIKFLGCGKINGRGFLL